MVDEEEGRCQNPQCRKSIVVLSGHRRRQYCDDACKQAAHRARLLAEHQTKEEAARQAQLERERALLRERWGDLLPETFDLLQAIRATSWAEQIAKVVIAEREWARQTEIQERKALSEEIMLGGEQLGFPALSHEFFDLKVGVELWLVFCTDASTEWLCLARDTVHMKLWAQAGRKRLAQRTPQP